MGFMGQYTPEVRRAMAVGILKKYGDELCAEIDRVGLPDGAADEFDAGLISAMDLIKQHEPAEG